MDKRLKGVLEHLLGPTGSIILHVIILIALVKYVVFETQQRAPDVEVVIMDPDAVDLEEFEEELEKLENEPQIVEAVEIPQVSLEDSVPEDVEFDSPDPSVDFDALDIASDVNSPLVMKGLFQGRSSSGRQRMLADYAGRWGKYTENAVVRALEWLSANQNDDGSWGPNKAAMTGLGLLTFLAHGETTASEKYGETVEKAIRFLIGRQDAGTGTFGNTASQHGPYTHAIATYAVSEAYGLTRIPSIKPVMEKAIKVILNGQQPGGGWNYKYSKGARRDTSVAGWQVQALKSAYIAGADITGLKDAMDRAARDLLAAQNEEDGRFFYTDSTSHTTDAITAIGVLSLQLLGHARAKEVGEGVDALKLSSCDWKDPPPWPLYAWYYVTQAKFHQGGQGWASWNAKFAKEYVKNQNDDGSWTSPGADSKLEHGKETNHGPVYSTALSALTLQVYYRFLPTYKSIALEPVDEADDDDVVIEVI